MKHVILQEKDQDVEKKLDWNYIEWTENEVESTGVSNAQTQTDWGPQTRTDKETQTSSPVIMHIDLTRTHSKLRHPSLVDSDGLAAPYFQFDRQAPGRISTSPTLRRMRSTRRPQSESREPLMMESTQEEPPSASTPSPMSPLSPVPRVISPLAVSPDSDGVICQVQQYISSTGRQRTKSHRSKTFDNGITSPTQECHSNHLSPSKDFVFPDSSESKVSSVCFWRIMLTIITVKLVLLLSTVDLFF